MANPKTFAEDVVRTFNGVDFEGVFLDFADSNKTEIVKQILKKHFTSVRTVRLGSKIVKNDQRICLLIPTHELTDDKFDLLEILDK